MRAVRWHARGDVRLDEVPVPSPADHEVLIRVEAAGICGTDIDEVRHGPITVPIEPHPVNGRMAPMTLGHEIVGIVEVAGPKSEVAVGTRVAPWPLATCGLCRDCRTGHANRCPFMVALGMSADGGLADYLVVAGGQCARVDPAVEVERAVLVEPFAVALHATHQVPTAGAHVAVVGIGSLGLCTIEAALVAGAADVIALSRSERARAMALEAGASAAYPLEAAGDVDAEIVFEAAGSRPALIAAVRAARRGGRLVVLGAHADADGLDLLALTVRELVLQGSVSHCFEVDFAAAARLIGDGRLARVRRPVHLAPLADGPNLLRHPSPEGKGILIPAMP